MTIKHITLACAAAALLASGGAQAAGCLKGAAVGGVAGHVAGKHAVLGAAGGCIVGHHMAKKNAAAQAQQAQPAQPQVQPAPAVPQKN